MGKAGHLLLRRFDSERIVFGTRSGAGWGVMAIAVLAWLLGELWWEWSRPVDLLLSGALGLVGLLGALFALWCHEMVVDLREGRFVRSRGLWPFVRVREGSLNDLHAVVLSRSRKFMSGPKLRRVRREVWWCVELDFFPFPGPLIVYQGDDEHAAYRALERFSRALDRPAIDRSSGVAEVIEPEELAERGATDEGGRGPVPAGRRTVRDPGPQSRPVRPPSVEPPPSSGIQIRSDGGAPRVLLPPRGISLVPALMAMAFGIAGTLRLLSWLPVPAVARLPDWMIPVIEGIGGMEVHPPGAVVLTCYSLAVVVMARGRLRQRVEVKPDRLRMTLEALGLPLRRRQLPKHEVERIEIARSTAPIKGLDAFLGRSGPTPLQVVLRSERAVLRLGDKPGGLIDDAGLEWLRDYLRAAVARDRVE